VRFLIFGGDIGGEWGRDDGWHVYQDSIGGNAVFFLYAQGVAMVCHGIMSACH
jgi:hypothetical protein